MRQVTATEKLRAVNEGKMAKKEFVRQMRQQFPMYITQFNGFDDSVQILKNKGMIFETKKEEIKPNYSLDTLERGVRVELSVLGVGPGLSGLTKEILEKATQKAKANLDKDCHHYLNLMSGESSKVDKNDKMKETKRGALEKDTFNDMKKATLKEIKQNLVEGTRALVGYLSGDRLTTTYNHYDGYPDNLGVGLQNHYNDDEKAKEVAMKGYITYLNPETGEIEATHNDAPGKLVLPDDAQQRAFEIAEEIDKFGADFGYIWDDETNQWITIKNTGIRSMANQIMDKLSMMNVYSGDKMNSGIDETEEEYLEKRDAAIKQAMGKDPKEMLKESLAGIIAYLKQEKAADNEIIKDFLKTHGNDIQGMSMEDIGAEFDEFVSVNYEQPSDFMQEEKADKDHDGDGEVESKEDEYKGVKDKAIKKAMGKKPNANEAVKNIITKILEEQVINEAATNELARIADEYGDFGGLKSAVIDLQNIVTDIEAYYDKTREKIQKVYNDLGDITNEEGLKVGAFIAPSIEAAFNKDLRPAVKKGFTSGLDTPKVKTISQADVDRGYIQREAPEEPKSTVFTPNF